MQFKFWGVRGSIAVPGSDTLGYGGNTTCIEVRGDNGEIVILDAGTGIFQLGRQLLQESANQIHLFISHTHWDHIQGLPNRFAGQGSKKYEQLIEGNIKFNTFKNWEKSLIKNSEYIALFPNVMIGLHLDHFYVFWLEPLAFNRTKEHMEMYYIGEESANSEELKELRKENARFWKDVMLEDVSAIEGMQKGRSSPVYNGGNFSPVMDNPTHQFHKWIAGNLI